MGAKPLPLWSVKINPMIIVGAVGLGVVGFIAATDPSSLDSSSQNPSPPSEPAHKAPIQDSALTPYTREEFPKTFDKFGSRISEIEAFRKKAAELASRNEECSTVVLSSLSLSSSTNTNLEFFVNCTNGSQYRQFRFSESELSSATESTVAISQKDKAIPEAQARKVCTRAIIDKANHPSTVEFNPFGSSYKVFPVNGNVAYYAQFSAQNSFGTKLKYEAQCLITPKSLVEISFLRERTS